MKNKLKSRSAQLTLWGMVTGFCNGLFGSGGGMIAVPVLQNTGKLDAKKSHATAIAVIFPLTVVSIFKYSAFCSPDYKKLAVICTGGIIGSIVGACFLKKFSDCALKRIFGIVMIVAAVRMVAL